MHTFNYISAGPGTGKTKSSLELAIDHLSKRHSVMYLCPTIALCDEVATRSNGHLTAIHSSNTSNVTATIIEALRDTSPRGLIVTQASLRMLPTHVRASFLGRFHAFHDESFEPLSIETLVLTDSYEHTFGDWFNLDKFDTSAAENVSTDVINEVYAVLSVKESAPHTTSERDSVYGPLHRLKSYVSNPDVEVFVKRSVLVDSLRTNLEDKRSDVHLKYSVFDLPSLYGDFASATFMGAAWTHQFLYHQWKARGVVWNDVTPRGLDKPLNSAKVTIEYYFADSVQRWSNYFKTSMNSAGVVNGQEYVDWVDRTTKGTPLIYSKNLSCSLEYPRRANWELLPGVSSGLNKWRDFNTYANFAAYLTSTADEAFLRIYNTSVSDASAMRMLQFTYQAALRGSLRDRDNPTPFRLIVPTLSDALALAQYLPEAKIVNIGKNKNGERTGIVGKLRTGWTPRPSVQTKDDKRPAVAEYSFGLNTRDMAAKSLQDFGFEVQPNIHPLADIIVNHRDSMPSIYNGKKRKSVEEIARMKKEEMPFFTNGVFFRGERFLGTNIKSASDFLAFDFDDSVLTDDDLKKIFTGQFVRYTTTHDKSTNGLRRFRLVVPLDRPVTVFEWNQLMEYYADSIRKMERKLKQPKSVKVGKNGDPLPAGLDMSCMQLSRKYYLPHAESDVEYVYKKRVRTVVNKILLDLPRKPTVTVPTIQDIVTLNNATAVEKSILEDESYMEKGADSARTRIESLFKEMGPGNRSALATRIGGLAKNLPDSEKYDIVKRLEILGVDKSAVRSARGYMGLARTTIGQHVQKLPKFTSQPARNGRELISETML